MTVSVRGFAAFLLALTLTMALGLLVACSEPPRIVTTAQAAPFMPDMAPPAARKHRAAITREGRLVWGLDAPLPALAAQLHAESGWREDARSGVGAAGLGQFMPKTAEEMERLYPELAPADPYNADWAIRAQARYMRLLWERTAGAADACTRYAFAVASYNAGPGWIDRDRACAARTQRDPAQWFGHAENCSMRADWASQETRGYVRRILLDYQPRYYAAWGRLTCPERLT